jgi:hypothetical protein
MNLVVAIVIVLAATCVAVTAMLLVRRNAPDGGYFNDGDRAAGVFGVLATGFRSTTPTAWPATPI